MKIMFITHEDAKFGAPKSMMELIKTLMQNYSIKPIVLVHSKDDVYRFCINENIEVYVTHHMNFIIKKDNNIVKKILKKKLYQTTTYLALKKIKRNKIMDEVDIIHSNVSVIDLGIKLSKLYNIPHVIHLREPDNYIDSHYFCKKNFIEDINTADYIIAISDFIKKRWISRGIDKRKVHIIYNGLCFDDIVKKYECCQKKEVLKGILCGSFSDEKGQKSLINAVSLLDEEYRKRVSIDIIGNGSKEYKNELKKMVCEEKLDSCIKIYDYDPNIRKKYCNYDIGFICSQNEAFGRVTAEYMYAGILVLGSDTGATPELLEGNCGLLYENNNVFDLKKKIELIVDDKVPDKMIYFAREKVNSSFTTLINAKNIYGIYKEIYANENKS